MAPVVTRFASFSYLLLLSLTTISLLSGCAANFGNSAATSTAGVALTGTIYGGQQPVSGAKIYLYAAGTAGYGTASRSMLFSPGYVSTDAGGGFSISYDYTCQSGDQVYLLAQGGNPGMVVDNPAIALMAALGPCSALQPSTHVIVNEVTTVAAAYALSGFMTSATALSSSGTSAALTGVTNAFLNAANLVSTDGGFAFAVTPGGNGAVPNAELNTLANIMASCINSDGSTTSGTPCASLFTAATPSGGSAPTDTVQAILNIAHNPGSNVASLFALASSSAPFQPSLSTAPNDWTVAVAYTLPATLSGGLDFAIDGNGNIWVPGNHGLLLYDPVGKLLSPSTGYTAGLTSNSGVGAIAIDSSNNAWAYVGEYISGVWSNPRIIKISSAGVLLSPANGYIGGGFATYSPFNLNFDASGNLWGSGSNAAGTAYAATEISSAGIGLGPYATPNQAQSSLWTTGDAAGSVWVGPTQFSSTGTVLHSNSPCGASLFAVMSIDHNGNLWTPAGDILECNSTGVQISPGSGYSSGIAQSYEASYVDGGGNVWYVDEAAVGRVGVISNSGASISPTGGYQAAIAQNYGTDFMAIDGSGNVWLGSDNPYLIQFVGAAVPVVTPLATATATNSLGIRP